VFQAAAIWRKPKLYLHYCDINYHPCVKCKVLQWCSNMKCTFVFRAAFVSAFLGKGITVTERSAHQNCMTSKRVSLSYTKSRWRGTGRERGLSGLIHCHSKPPIWIEVKQHYNLLWAFFFVSNSLHEWWAQQIIRWWNIVSPLFTGSSMVDAQYLKARIRHLFSWDKAKSW
jgi:hypothetical protein